METLQQFKCPNCDGAITFDPTVQKMKCPYCDSELETEAILSFDQELKNAPDDRMEWDTAAGSQWQGSEADGLRVYQCNACGGEIVGDETTSATSCPYCGNAVVMIGQLSGALKPDYVIPFKLDKTAAIAALKKHYSGKPLLPKVFKDENHIQEVKGIYVPFWLFGADADAHIRYKATRLRSWTSGDYRYTETRHYAVTRGGNISFAQVPVDGSSKMDDSLMESIEPYDFSQAVDFQSAYLAGFFADKYDVDSHSSIARANQRIRQSTESAFATTVLGYATVIPVASSIQLKNSTASYALYPVWLLNTQWKGKKFTFAMNGQTGKMAGDLPLDVSSLFKWLIGLTAGITSIAYAMSYLFWLL